MANEGGDNYTGGPDDWQGISPGQAGWMNANQGTPTWDPSGTWDMGQSWWDRNTPSPATLAQINAMRGGLSSLKPLADTSGGSGIPARPAAPAASIHQGGGGGDALTQYLQMLQQRQQQMRSLFLPKTAGLLGGG